MALPCDRSVCTSLWVGLKKIDFAEGAPELKLNLVNDLALENGIAGDVTDTFEDTGSMKFLTLEWEQSYSLLQKPTSN